LSEESDFVSQSDSNGLIKGAETYDQIGKEMRLLMNPEWIVLIPKSIFVLPGPGRAWQMAKSSWNLRHDLRISITSNPDVNHMPLKGQCKKIHPRKRAHEEACGTFGWIIPGRTQSKEVNIS
jgi:hypothetical protein